jgi:hypothetical protein
MPELDAGDSGSDATYVWTPLLCCGGGRLEVSPDAWEALGVILDIEQHALWCAAARGGAAAEQTSD